MAVQMDPSEWIACVGSLVNVHTIESKTEKGWVYTVDPETYSVILVSSKTSVDTHEINDVSPTTATLSDNTQRNTSDDSKICPTSVSVVWLFYTSIAHIEIVDSIGPRPTHIDSIFLDGLSDLLKSSENASTELGTVELNERCDKVLAHLKAHRLPVTEEWVNTNHASTESENQKHRRLCVLNTLFINPPYDAKDCTSTNEVVLSRVQRLLDRLYMP
eukprot:CFRG3888T1